MTFYDNNKIYLNKQSDASDFAIVLNFIKFFTWKVIFILDQARRTDCDSLAKFGFAVTQVFLAMRDLV